MLSSGAKARRFLRPGNADAVFARKRGMIAPSPLKESKVEPDKKTKSRFGKATSADFTNFFGNKRTVKAVRGAVNALKEILVETFIAAKSLGATVRNIVKQLGGLNASGGAGGLLGKLGMVGLVAAVVAGVAAIFGPKIKEVFESFKKGADAIFENIKGFLDGIEQKIKSIYNFVADMYNNKFKGLLRTYNDAVQAIADKTGIPLPKINMGMFKDVPAYTEQFPEGLNPLAGKTLDSVMGDVGNMLKGGLENTTGVMGDLFNNLLDGLGLTDTANAITDTLGMGSLFGKSRELGSGGGLSTFFPGMKPSSSSSTGGGVTDPTISGDEEEYLMRLMNAEAGGEGELGMAAVGRSVLNRAALIQSGEVGAGQFMAESGSIKDVIEGTNQYQPFREGKLKKELTEEERVRAKKSLEIARNQASLRGNLEASGMSADQINNIMASTGFRTHSAKYDGSQDVNPTRLGGHQFNTAGNANMLTPTAKFKEPSTTQQQQYTIPTNEIPKEGAPQAEWDAYFKKVDKLKPPKKGPNVSFISVPGAQQIAQAPPRRPQPLMTGNGPGTEGSDYSFFPSGNPDQYDIFGAQLGAQVG